MTGSATPQELQLVFIAMAERYAQFMESDQTVKDYNELCDVWAHLLPKGGNDDALDHLPNLYEKQHDTHHCANAPSCRLIHLN